MSMSVQLIRHVQRLLPECKISQTLPMCGILRACLVRCSGLSRRRQSLTDVQGADLSYFSRIAQEEFSVAAEPDQCGDHTTLQSPISCAMWQYEHETISCQVDVLRVELLDDDAPSGTTTTLAVDIPASFSGACDGVCMWVDYLMISDQDREESECLRGGPPWAEPSHKIVGFCPLSSQPHHESSLSSSSR